MLGWLVVRKPMSQKRDMGVVRRGRDPQVVASQLKTLAAAGIAMAPALERGRNYSNECSDTRRELCEDSSDRGFQGGKYGAVRG